jgi:long-chain acyl-CoA synthetase
VSNICVHADTNAKQPIAIVIPHEANLRAQLNEKGTPLADLCQRDDVRSLVMKECNAAGKKQGFKTMEMLEAVILTPDDWTPENGLVTAAQKINRKKVSGKFDSEIKVRFHICLRGCMNSADVTLRRSTSTNEH